MPKPIIIFILGAFAATVENAYAVPGPLISGGVGLISNAAALFAIGFGFVAMSVTAVWSHVRHLRHARPKTFFGTFGIAVVTLACAIWFVSSSQTSASPYDPLRVELAKRAEAESANDAEVPLSVLLANLDAKAPGTKFSEPRLEEEIAYSIGRNNNVVWNRYLSAGKVPVNEATFEALRTGKYEIALSVLFENGKLSQKFDIVDLRTKLEFDTSAHFKNSVNAEYRAVVNDEFPFDKSKKYVFICHDGAADLSRSLIATAYLRSKWYEAYALRTGMRPILDRLGIAPASYSKKTDYRVYAPSDTAGKTVFVDTLWALEETLAKRWYPAGIEVVNFPFYKMDSGTYSGTLASVDARITKGEDVRFACYDTFSCFYARIFIESLADGGRMGMGIFR